MNVFLDTNVLASAVATRGLCADVFRLVLASHRLIVSEQVFEELDRVLNDKFGVPSDIREDIQLLLREDITRVPHIPSLNLKIKDQADIVLLEFAAAVHTDLFVTGAKELLALKHIGPMHILSPRSFWEKMKSGSGKNT